MLDTEKIFLEVKTVLSKGLPGDIAHHEMLPSTRLSAIRHPHATGAIPSAVLLLLYPKNEHLYMVLIQRTKYRGIHSHQISFPGGRMESYDISPVETAVRETHEEIGIEKNTYRIAGGLSTLYIPPSNFMVYPFMAVADTTPVFIPSEDEVEAILEIPVNELFNKSNKKTLTPPGYKEYPIQVPAYVIDEHIIWGATAMIMAEMINILSETKSIANKK